MTRYSQLMASLLVIAAAASAEAQLLPVLHDYQQPMAYSPDDPFVKGKVFRYHTGHAGKFYNCDCEEQKRYSPYITWHSVCNRDVPRHYCHVLYCDILEVKSRVRSGSCRGFSTCSCADCLAGRDTSEFQLEYSGALHMGQGDRELQMPIREAEATNHLVYGNRQSRHSANQDVTDVDELSQRRGVIAELPKHNPVNVIHRR